MVDHGANDGDTSIKVSSGPASGVRKFTLSCSRCRASKLKCDKTEPCMECVKRNVGHLCTKDERHPRAKRAKKAKTDHNDNNKTKINGLQDQHSGAEAEEAARVFERFVNGTSRVNADLPAILESTISFVAPDYPNMHWISTNDSQRQGEKLALIQEIIDAIPEPDIIRLLYDIFVTRCQGPLANVVHTPTFKSQAGKLCDCLNLASPEAQAMALSSTMSMDILACHLLALVLALAFHPPPSILGWIPTPLTFRVEELRASDVYPKTWRSLALRCLQGEVALFCGSIASLQAAIMLLLDGQEGLFRLDAILVTAISGAQKLGLHRLGGARLKASVLPASFSEEGSPISTEPPHIRTETGVRIWWALVMRDWSRGQALGYYSIHPSQFNTRVPLHINDDDLCPATLKVNVDGQITEQPRSEFTMLSYTVHAIELAILAREIVDLRGPLCQAQRQEEIIEAVKMRNNLDKKYENFVAGLPSYFRMGSIMGLNSTGPLAAIPVHRWMLHQQLWSIFLRLHQISLSSQDDRVSCHLLAQNIINNQAQIQARCAVCSSLSASKTQLFNAAIVLLVDLLLPSKDKDPDLSSTKLSRSITRDKIGEAIGLLRARDHGEGSSSPQDVQPERTKAYAHRSIVLLEALMKLEEEESGNSEAKIAASSTRNGLGSHGAEIDNNARKMLKEKVMDILEALQGNAGNAKNTAAEMEQAGPDSFSTLDMSMPFATATDGSLDLDVLPVLSNDPSCNFWQFLDLGSPPQSSTENASFPNLQTPIDSAPFGPFSGVAHSLGSFVGPHFADVYSSTDGIGDTHASPSSIESRPTKLGGENEATTTSSSADAYVAANFY